MHPSPEENLSFGPKKREEDRSERPDYVFSHRKGSDIHCLIKKVLKPILNPLFSLQSGALDGIVGEGVSTNLEQVKRFGELF